MTHPSNCRILLVEDNPPDARLVTEALADQDVLQFSLTRANGLRAALAQLGREAFDVILLDLALPDSVGFATFAELQQYAADVPIIVLSGLDDETLAVRTVRAGAQDYLLKELVDGQVVQRAVRYAVERHRLQTSYRSLIENAPYGIYRSSLDGRFLVVNRAMVDLLGYDSTADVLALDPPRTVFVDPTEYARLASRGRSGHPMTRIEAKWTRQGGGEIAVRLSGRAVLTASGQVECFEMIAEDVTEQKRLEAQLRQAQKMEAVGRLTAGIAHDFNNLLTVVVANTDLAIDALPTRFDAVRRDLQDANGAARRGSHLIKQLLGFCRNETLDVQPINVAELVAELGGVVRRLIPEDIAFRLEASQAGSTARVDPRAVEQMVLNLVTNARDAMEGGGRLTIRVTPATLDDDYLTAHPWCQAGEYVVLAVTDTGTGMDATTVDRVFEPFFTTKPVGEGSGLGLAMIYGLMKQHGGFVHVESEVAAGTVVELLFPRVAEMADAHTRRVPSTDLPHGVETILVVEDEPAVRRATKRALERFGYTVLVAENGEEALQVFRRRRSEIQLIITDLVMPKQGGRRLYQAVRHDGQSVRVLLTSGYSAGDIAADSGLPDGAPFLRKPWTLSELLVCVRETLDTEQLRQDHAAQDVVASGES